MQVLNNDLEIRLGAPAFLSPDPVFGDITNPGAWNRYAYCRGNPVNYVDPDGRYGIDIHLGLTHYLALMAGFSPDDALKIALADQSIDEGDTEPEKQFRRNVLSSRADLRVAMDLHFPIGPGDRVVVRNSPYVNHFIDAVMQSGSIEIFGQRLHTYQDSWAHEGFVNHHIWAGKNPDKTYIKNRWKDLDLEMALYTFKKMLKFIDETNYKAARHPKFDTAFIQTYLRQRHLSVKELLLRQQGLDYYAKPIQQKWYQSTQSRWYRFKE